MAANSGAIRAGRAFVELFGDDSKLVRVLNQASKKVKAFGTGLMSIGGSLMAGGMAIAAPIAAAVKEFSDFGSALNDMSARTGVSVESLGELGYAAQLAGADLDTLESGIRKMQKNLGKAGEVSKDAAASLAEIGLNAEELQAMAPEEQFQAIADGISGIEDSTKKSAIAMALFGKSGTMLLPMLDGLAETREEARRLGLVLSTADASAADKLSDTLDTLWASIKGVGMQIGAALAPSITDLAAGITENVAKVIAWVKANKDLIVTVAKIVGWVIAGGAALVALGGTIYVVGMALGGLASIAGVIGSAFSLVVGVFGFIATAFGAILSPLGLLVAGLIGLATYFTATGQAGEWIGDILGWLGESFGWLKDTALKVWNAISTAIASGDIAAAFNVAWTSIKVIWTSGTSWLYQKWAAFKGWFLQVWNEAVYGTAMLMTDAWAGMQRTWVSVVAGMKVVWSQFTTWAANTWNSMQQGIGNVFLSALEKIGVLTAQEAQWAKEDMNKTLNDQKSERTKTADAYQAEIAREAEARKKQITSEQNATNEALVQDMKAKDEARQKAIDADVAASKAAAEKARAEWDAAMGLAGVADTTAQPGGPGKPKGFAGVDVSGQGKSKVMSTFNAFALSGFGVAGNAQEETARNTRETARVLKKFEWSGIQTSVRAE